MLTIRNYRKLKVLKCEEQYVEGCAKLVMVLGNNFLSIWINKMKLKKVLDRHQFQVIPNLSVYNGKGDRDYI